MLEPMAPSVEFDCAHETLIHSVSSINTLDFLKTILPEHGIHYLALFKEGYKFPAHKVYTDLETMADAIDNMAGSRQFSVYHACATYQRAVIEIEDGEKTKRKYRVPENWGRAKSFWVDIDCGQEKFDKGDGYLTQRDAVAAIFQFSDKIGWPHPMIVNSGNGIHAYWPLTKDIASVKWVKVAKSLKVAMHQCDVIADPTRTADFASILRPAGSINRKNGAAKPVTVQHVGMPSDPEQLANALNAFTVAHGIGNFKGDSFHSDSFGLNDDLISHLKGAEGQESFDTVGSALRLIDPGISRHQWRTVVWGVRHGLGDTPEALELANQWSKGGLHTTEFQAPSNYSGRHEVELVWNSYNASRPDRVTIGSLFKMASDEGWEHPNYISDAHPHELVETSSVPHSDGQTVGLFQLADGDVHILVSPPPKRSYVFAGTVTAGSYNVLAGSGGTLKTMLMMTVAAHMAVGRDFGSLQIAQGSAMLFLGEEDQAEVGRRLSAACKHYGLDRAVVTSLVKAFPAAGVDLRLTRALHGTLDATSLVNNIIELAKQQACTCGQPVRLIVVDHARLAMDGDPDDAAHVTQLTRVLTRVAQASGSAVILLAHSPKSVLRQQAKEMSIADVAGSSAFSDNARAGFLMSGMREDDAKELKIPDADRRKYVKLECAKANYGPQGTEWWFEKVTLDDWQVQVLNPAALFKPIFQPGQAKQQLKQRIVDHLIQKPGRSKRQLRDVSGRSKFLGASEKEVEAARDVLLEEGRIELRKPTPAECIKHRLTAGRELLFFIEV